MKFFKVKNANLIDVTITFDNGDIIETNVNGNQTDDQIKEYYKVGKTFNLGDGEKDKLAKVVDIKIDRSMEKQSAIQQPNKPKPTTTLPDNMEWSWDPNAANWVAVMKNNTNVTPPLYNPQNQNLVNNNATTYMSNVKTASSDKYEYMLLDRLIQDAKYFIEHPDLKHLWAKTLDEHISKMKEQYTKLDPKPEWTSEDSIDELAKKMKEAYSNHWNEVHPDNKIESSLTNCLSEFLDGPRYSKEIKIEAGLIKDGLVKYAGFDFNKGTKYEITEKGLKVLRSAAEKEHNEALNEREKLAYLFGFNTDEVSTLDTTGKVIKSDKKYTICEADGTELGEVEANNELDAKVKFGIEHPEYADSQSICAKEIKAGLEYSGAFEYNDYKIDLFNDTDGGATFVIYAPKGKTVNHESMYKGTASTMDEAITKAYLIINRELGIVDAKKLPLYKQKDPYYSDEAQISLFKTSINDVKRNFEQIAGIPLKQFCLIYKENNNEEFKKIYDKITDYISKKYNYNVNSMQWFHSFCDMIEKQCNKIDAKYEETTESHEPYPNPSETPNDHIILENHDGWVNTASFEDDVRKQFQKPHQKLPNSDRDLALLEKQILEITDEDTRDTVRKIFDEFQFSDKEAAQVTPEFAKLHKLLGEYRKQSLITLTDLDGNLVATGDPQVINNLEHEVKDIGYYCESVSEDTDSDYAETYSLKIFMK